MNFIINDIKLCSVNLKYLSRKYILTNEYRDCKKRLVDEFTIQKTGTVNISEYKIHIKIHCYGDSDNYLKIIFDSMQIAGIFKNDRDILHYEIEKVKIKKGSLNKLEINFTRKCK